MSKKIGQCIYLLHGWALNGKQRKMWQPFIEALEAGGVKTKLLKIPGLSAPLKEVWGLDEYIEWLLKELPDQPVILLGHSFGGQLGIRLASKHPDRVKKLILIDSSGIRDWSLLARARRDGLQRIAKLGRRLTNSDLIRQGFYKVIGVKDYYQAPPLLKQTMSKVITDEVWQDLPKIKQDTLIIWGREDRTTSLKLGKKMHGLIPDSMLEVIDDARHSPHLTQSSTVSAVILKFLKE